MKTFEDVLNWWWCANASEFPVLSKKAFEFLQIPASGAMIESMFSEVKHVFCPTRQRLSILSELLVVKSFVRTSQMPLSLGDIRESVAEADIEGIQTDDASSFEQLSQLMTKMKIEAYEKVLAFMPKKEEKPAKPEKKSTKENLSILVE